MRAKTKELYVLHSFIFDFQNNDFEIMTSYELKSNLIRIYAFSINEHHFRNVFLIDK